MRVLAAHQPDLLPWTGFWHKMAKADVMDLAIYDQFQDRGYQRRVRMRDDWASLTLVGKPKFVPIHEVRLAEHAPDHLIDVVRGRYSGARFWPQHGDWLIHAIDEARSERLWLFNVALIVAIRDRLGIRTPIAIAHEPRGLGTDGLLDIARQYDAKVYLSGQGGREYMGDAPEERFAKAGRALLWSRHESPTSDSIVSVLMDFPEPMHVVMAERVG